MTRYPVHVGSIPAYQLAEMDRINEPYRKDRAMTDDPGEREAEKERLAQALRDGDMATFTAAVRKANRPMSTRDIEHERRRMTKDLASPDPVTEPVARRCPKCQFVYGRHALGCPVSEPVDGLREAIDAVADALNGWDQGEEPREDTHRHWSRIVAALAAAPAEPVDGLREAVNAYIAWQYRMKGARRFTLTDLRAALAAAPAEDRGGVDALRFIEYLWTATGKDPNVHVCDLFDLTTDPIVDDIERFHLALAARQAGDPR